MFGLSVRNSIRAIVAIFSVLAVLGSGATVWNEFKRFGETTDARTTLDALDSALDAIQFLGLERGVINAALLAPGAASAQARAVLDQHIAQSDRALRAAADTLRLRGDPAARQGVAEVERLLAQLAPLRERALAGAAVERSARAADAGAAYVAAMIAINDAVDTFAARLERETGALSGDMGDYAGAARFATALRDHAGRRSTGLVAAIASGAPMSPAAVDSWMTATGRVDMLWRALGNAIDGRDDPAMRAAIATVDRQFLVEMGAVYDAVLRAGRADGKYPMTVDEFRTRNTAAIQTIVAAKNAAIASGRALGESHRADALALLAVAGGLALIALVAGLAAIFSFDRRVGAPLEAVTGDILALARGELDVEIAGRARNDEIGKMASALETLREGARAARTMDAEREAARKSETERARALAELCRSFDARASELLGGLTRSSDALRGTAGAMEGLARDSSAQAGEVESASTAATANVETVAAAAEELSSSIREISGRMQASARSVRAAAERAGETNKTVERLNAGAQRIGEVVKLIAEIAAQTNLLALNATIEAARAGEAGKGFAVVASEVKNLATQTGRATEDISRLIEEIRSATGQAVEEIRGIGSAIGEIDQGTTAVAAAVEEQGAATQEISRNVQQAAEGTSRVTRTIGALADASRRTGSAAGEVNQSVAGMTEDAARLREAVADFLGRVKVA